jgi:hypothetical protein
MIRFCHCGRPIAAHAAGEKCEKPRVRIPSPGTTCPREAGAGTVDRSIAANGGEAPSPGANSTYGRKT